MDMPIFLNNREDPIELKFALIQVADGEIEWVKELLSLGADPNGMPLIMAIQCREPEIVRLMVGAGADVNLRFAKTTPLIRAITSCGLEIIQILIDAGADVNWKDEEGLSPLKAVYGKIRLTSTDEDRENMANILLAAGAVE
jgi:ankyrin repeat protein